MPMVPSDMRVRAGGILLAVIFDRARAAGWHGVLIDPWMRKTKSTPGLQN
jgi:hypothetical protein